MAILCDNKLVDVHAKYGSHEHFRLFQQPTDLLYNKITSNLILLSRSDIQKFSLEKGKFHQPISVNSTLSFCISSLNPLMIVGCDDNVLFFDDRVNKEISRLEVKNTTAIDIHGDNIKFIIGNTKGYVKEFDFRIAKEQNKFKLENNVKQLQYVNKSVNILTENCFSIFEMSQCIDTIKIKKLHRFDSMAGLFALCGDFPMVKTFFSTSIGVLPEFCKYIEEEFEEDLENYILINYENIQKMLQLDYFSKGLIKIYKNKYYLHKTVYNNLGDK